MPYLRHLPSFAGAAFAAALAAAPAAAQQVLLDFAEFRSAETVEYQATPGGDVNSRGFSLYAAFAEDGGARNALGAWGTQQDPTHLPTNLGPTAAALWGTRFGERIDLEATDAQLFNLYAIDAGHMYPRSYLVSGDLAPINLFFYGYNAAGAVAATQSFTIPAPAVVGGVQAPVLSTLTFGAAWRALSAVAWYQQSGPSDAGVTGSNVSHQFTNVRAEVVPEPATFVLVAGGLAAAAAAGARRRRSA